MLDNLEAIFFDLDGTLVDSRVPIARAINHGLRVRGFPEQPDGVLHPKIGDSLHGIFVELAGSDHAVACIEAYREHYREGSLRDTTVFDAIPAALEALGRVYRLGVVTAKPLAFTEPILERTGLRGCFEVVEGPALGRGEPETKSQTLARALDALGLGARAAAAMVGDRSHDILAARENDVHATGVLWGSGSEHELREAGAAMLVGTPAELVDVFAPEPKPGPILSRTPDRI